MCRGDIGRDQIVQRHVKILHKLIDASQRSVAIGTDEMHRNDRVLFAHLFQTSFSVAHTVFLGVRLVI